jgi:hypothetical protein
MMRPVGETLTGLLGLNLVQVGRADRLAGDSALAWTNSRCGCLLTHIIRPPGTYNCQDGNVCSRRSIQKN